MAIKKIVKQVFVLEETYIDDGWKSYWGTVTHREGNGGLNARYYYEIFSEFPGQGINWLNRDSIAQKKHQENSGLICHTMRDCPG